MRCQSMNGESTPSMGKQQVSTSSLPFRAVFNPCGTSRWASALLGFLSKTELSNKFFPHLLLKGPLGYLSSLGLASSVNVREMFAVQLGLEGTHIIEFLCYLPPAVAAVCTPEHDGIGRRSGHCSCGIVHRNMGEEQDTSPQLCHFFFVREGHCLLQNLYFPAKCARLGDSVLGQWSCLKIEGRKGLKSKIGTLVTSGGHPDLET